MHIIEIKSAPIGLPVVVAEVLSRVQSGGKREWKTKSERWHLKNIKPRNGYLTGYVSLKNGVVEWYEDHNEWYPEQGPALFAARVKFSARGCEYYARPEDVTVAPKEAEHG